MNRILVIITAFSLGYVLNDLTETDIRFIPKAQAEISASQIENAVRNAINARCYIDQDIGYIYCL